jgi:hypothetical protein
MVDSGQHQADIAGIYQLLDYAGVRLVTVEEGEIDEMKIGFKGTMNALVLKALALKTRRGLRGQVERGKMAGGLSYGNRVASRGVWEIVPEQAAVVLRIFRLYAPRISPVAIAKQLNAEGIPGPDGCAWSPSTIHGHMGRGTGILNNEMYVGVYVWPKQRFRKNPRTGKRIARPVPDSERGRYPRLHLRLDELTEELWQAVKARQTVTRHTMKAARVHGRRPVHLFSKLTKCAECGGGYNVSSRDELRCFNHVKRGTCSNTKTIGRRDLETRALKALKEQFLGEPVAFAEFCEAFTSEMNRLRREHRARLATAPREITAINRRSKEILDLLLSCWRDEAWKEELRTIERRRAELEATIAAAAHAEPPLPALLPNMRAVYQERVAQLAAALEQRDDEQRERAREAVRALIQKIVIPADVRQPLMVFGDLGKMLAAAAGGRDGSTLAAVAYDGCGGSQPSEFGVRLGSSLSSESYNVPAHDFVARCGDAQSCVRSLSRHQNEQFPGSRASIRRTASAGMTCTTIVRASTVSSFLRLWTWPPPGSTNPIPCVYTCGLHSRSSPS